MAHRGPDGINHWRKGSVALGQCMLRTTPESLEEHQPLTNEDENLVLVMDGRVDNWEELRKELLGRGAVLRTRADAELVLRAYEIWGRDCLTHIDGDFALVIWDARRREAFCARDRIGNKPFHYRCDDGSTFVFASELHLILALPGVPQILNEAILAEFLANEWYSRNETLWRGILRLVAAHWMVVDQRGTRLHHYWKPDFWATLPCKKTEDYTEHYRELFADVVRRMSRSHRPVAYEVSGGLDSSAIFAIAEHLRLRQTLPTPAIKGYTLDFSGAGSADELKFGRAVSQFLRVTIAESPATEKPLSWYRDWSARYREFPGYPNGVMALGLRETARNDGCRAILTGVGGDEWLGMPWFGAYYAEDISARNWLDVYSSFADDCRRVGCGEALWLLLRHGVAPLLPEPVKRPIRSVRAKRSLDASWLSDKLKLEIELRRRIHLDKKLPSLRTRGQRKQIAILTAAYDALARELEERLSSSLGLELRSPFLNRAIIQFAFSTPERLRTRGRVTKWLHRNALSGFLPDAVLNRDCKADFMVTFHRNLEKLEDEMINTILPRRTEWVRPSETRSLLNDSFGASGNAWSEWLLWTLIGCDAISLVGNDRGPKANVL